ncbi:phytoene desaturase family protein [Metabacillus bambusae]|uniref:NAD(P)/FAD-dependent oxidoreductase n=1 Tax=Metabacillus bambusae TaxID=2795218 RepID=A0ABS3NAK3_9BACI|nr:FAD-dependent oxidoreductase [Metabacillus bambusae]MBO1515253.1 NAD(P)/FAD-dependent oxidoreductase [Metabacillus bambusae]
MGYSLENTVGKTWDCVVIGGGIAGLTAANFIAQSGKSVLLLEKSNKYGGRAITEEKKGALLNLGPHALYSKGNSLEILTELGIDLKGASPSLHGDVFYQSKSYDAPISPLKLLKSRLFNWSEKKELIRFVTGYQKIDTAELQNTTLNEWLQLSFKAEQVRMFIRTLARLATYCHDPEYMSAGAAIRQLQLGKAVYLHDGWQMIIESLKERARSLGVEMVSGYSVQRVNGKFPQLEVVIKEKESVFAKTVLSTASPSDTASILAEHEQSLDVNFLNAMLPVRVACMDVVLKNLPKPKNTFALSMDQPLYFSVHSNTAKLSHHNQYAVIHVMKYLACDNLQDEIRDRDELEQLMSRMQPGWEKLVVYKRYLPRLIASNSLVYANKNGVYGRPDPVSPIPGFFIAGDWVGSVGMLVDCTFASAKQAATRIIKICI